MNPRSAGAIIGGVLLFSTLITIIVQSKIVFIVGPSGLFEILPVTAGVLLLVVSLPWLHASFGSSLGHPYKSQILGVTIAFGFVLFIFVGFIPVRSEPSGWYYHFNNGCWYEYQVGTGPDPNPPQQDITGMYYNLYGGPGLDVYPSSYHRQPAGCSG